MEDTYFVISNSDGDTTVEEISKTELLKRIADCDYGHGDFLTQLPQNTDTNYWGEGVLIIKGTIVTPKAEQVVTKYNIE